MTEIQPGGDYVPRSLGDWLLALQRQWMVGVLTAVATGALACFYVIGLPKLYRSSATVLVERVGDATAGEIDARLQSIRQEALSRTTLTDLVTRLDLYPALRENGGDVLRRIQRDIKLDNLTPEQINGQPSTIAFRVSYVGLDPASAAAVPNALSAFYVDQSDQMRSRKAVQTTQLLKEQLTDMKKRLDEQEARVRGYTARNIGALPEQVGANLATLERLNSQLRMNLDTQSKLVERRQTLRNQVAELDSKPPSDPNSPAGQLVQLRKQLSEQSRYTDKYPEVRALKEEIAALELQIASNQAAGGAASGSKTLQSAIAETESQIARLDRENDTLRRSIQGYERRVESTPAQAPAFHSLSGDYQVTRDQYDLLQKRYQEAQLAERAQSGKGRAEFRVLDAAQIPTSAAGPPKWQLLALGLLFALGVGLVAAAIADWLDTSFHSIDDLRAFTRVPVLTSIPRIPTIRDSWTQGVRVGVMVGATGAAVGSLAAVAFFVARESDGVARLLLRLG